MPLNSVEFAPAGARERLVALVLRSALRLAVKPVLSPRIPIQRQRRWLRLLSLRARGREAIYPAVEGGVRGEWVRTDGTQTKPPPSAAILYLHGGAYCVGSPKTHRAVTLHLARATRLPVFAADYRLAPEHPFPAAVEDAVAAYRALREKHQVVIAGDSAGAGLSLAAALELRQRHDGAPAALILMSPWIDLTLSRIADRAADADPMLSVSWLRDCARHYLASKDAATPLASPIYGELSGLPPTLIQVAADELLNTDAVRIHRALAGAGVSVRCEIVRNRWHVFQLCAGLLPSANAAIERAAGFIALNLIPNKPAI